MITLPLTRNFLTCSINTFFQDRNFEVTKRLIDMLLEAYHKSYCLRFPATFSPHFPMSLSGFVFCFITIFPPFFPPFSLPIHYCQFGDPVTQVLQNWRYPRCCSNGCRRVQTSRCQERAAGWVLFRIWWWLWRFPSVGVPPSHHPFLDGIFLEINHLCWGTPWLALGMLGVYSAYVGSSWVFYCAAWAAVCG